MRKKGFLWFIPSLLLMALIFYMSSRVSEESADMSGTLAEWLVKVFSNVFNRDMSDVQIAESAQVLDPIIRKFAHMTEYTLLSVSLVFGFVKGTKFRDYRIYVIPGVVSLLYAITDEVHQLFVPGRSGELRDVLIDCIGAMIGILLVYLLNSCVRASRMNKARKRMGA